MGFPSALFDTGRRAGGAAAKQESLLLRIEFRVDGEPVGQPRPRAFARKFGSTYQARVYDPGTAEGWKSCIAAAALPHRPQTPLVGPIRLRLAFAMRRPKSHYRTGKYSGELRADAPIWHIGTPDADNLAKAVLDALTQIGMWKDDAQVFSLHAGKRYTNYAPGCNVEIELVGLTEDSPC